MESSTHSAEVAGTPEEKSLQLEALRVRREERLPERSSRHPGSRNTELRKIALEAAELDRDFAIETALAISTTYSQVKTLGALGERLGDDAVVFQMAHEIAKEARFQGRGQAIAALAGNVARFYPRYAMEIVQDSLQSQWDEERALEAIVHASGDLEAAQKLRPLLLEGNWPRDLKSLVESTAEAHPEFAEETIQLMEDGKYKDAARDALEHAKARRQTSEPSPTPVPDETFPRLSGAELGRLIGQARRREEATYPAFTVESTSLIDGESFSQLSEETAQLYVESLVRIGEELHDSAALAEAAYLAAQLKDGEAKDRLLLRIIKTADPDTLRSAMQRQR
ncbi:MAG: hypothetical protein Q8Q11_01270 [bacterium]|nr:hypothetical protein [bacterium]MDZ4247761.1 hypothetical protein [Patescibacteria group bacterium]